jgi:hypothetical protein
MHVSSLLTAEPISTFLADAGNCAFVHASLMNLMCIIPFSFLKTGFNVYVQLSSFI